MQISGAGDGGRMAGREPVRPARAVAQERFRPDYREAARTARLPDRETDAPARPGSPTTLADPRRLETKQAEARRADAASEARSRRDRADDAAETTARRKDAVAKDRADKDKIAKDKVARDAADERVRIATAAKPGAATGAKLPAAMPEAAQAEAARAAASDETAPDDEPEMEGDPADAPDASAATIPAAPVTTAPASGTGAAAGAVPVDQEAGGAAIQPAPTRADPRIAALVAEASARAGDPKDATEGSAVPAPDGLPAPDPSAPAPQMKSAEAATSVPAEARPPVSVQAPLSAVPITIGMRALAGSNRFEIRLDPYELGRIDVRLDIDRQHGAVKAHLVVERPETLALLQRDAGSLQQALSQAGLDPGEAGLTFSLRDGSGQNPQHDQAGRPQGSDRQGSDRQGSDRAVSSATEAEAQALPPLRSLGQRLGLDLRI
ncbi:flagellar hook-length control protein FliK [Methylobacterium currus]|nr:flagellar hook-length control protein FliK [Methylobacterium currus]